MFAARIGKQFGDIGIASILIACLVDTVLCSSCRPQAETVVMLYNSNTTIHTGSLHCCNPLLRIRHSQRSILRLSFIAIAPLQSCECVHTIVEKSVELSLVPQKLPVTGHRVYRKRCIVGVDRHLVIELQLCRYSERSHHTQHKQRGKKFFHFIWF